MRMRGEWRNNGCHSDSARWVLWYQGVSSRGSRQKVATRSPSAVTALWPERGESLLKVSDQVINRFEANIEANEPPAV